MRVGHLPGLGGASLQAARASLCPLHPKARAVCVPRVGIKAVQHVQISVCSKMPPADTSSETSHAKKQRAAAMDQSESSKGEAMSRLPKTKSLQHLVFPGGLPSQY